MLKPCITLIHNFIAPQFVSSVVNGMGVSMIFCFFVYPCFVGCLQRIAAPFGYAHVSLSALWAKFACMLVFRSLSARLARVLFRTNPFIQHAHQAAPPTPPAPPSPDAFPETPFASDVNNGDDERPSAMQRRSFGGSLQPAQQQPSWGLGDGAHRSAAASREHQPWEFSVGGFLQECCSTGSQVSKHDVVTTTMGNLRTSFWYFLVCIIVCVFACFQTPAMPCRHALGHLHDWILNKHHFL